MSHSFKFNVLALALASAMLTGCGDAKTTLIEQEPIEVIDEDDGHGHDHGDDDYTITSLGRLAVMAKESNDLAVFELDNNTLLESFALTHTSNSLTVSADARFAVISSRNNDYVGFIDGGLWREDHGAHLHDYQQAPAMSSFELSGSRPTHVVKHGNQMAVFYDGNSEIGTTAAVHVVTDSMIASNTNAIPTINYDVNMHGVAEPRGDHVLASIRRDDASSTSNAKILPDQVGVYHLHDGEYDLETVFDVTCPDLHGAAQNDTHVVFGCSDGVLVAEQAGDEYSAVKIANSADLDGLRIGSIYAHHEASNFIGVASAHGGSHAVLAAITPASQSMAALSWQPSAKVLSYSYSRDGAHFLVLDAEANLNVLAAHSHDGELEWEFEKAIQITDADLAAMPEGSRFSMSLGQDEHLVYVSDPINNTVLAVDLEDSSVTQILSLDFIPSDLVWLGISETHHDE